MKRTLKLCVLFSFLFMGTARAQDENLPVSEGEVESPEKSKGLSDSDNDRIWKDRAKYFNIGYVNQTLTSKGDLAKYESSVGANLTWGKTYYLHKKPILNMIKIGLDWSWMDLNYVQYSDMETGYAHVENIGRDYYGNDDDDKDFDIGSHQIEYGMQIGPSVTVNPIQDLKVSTYFRFQPSMSAVILDDEVYYGFVPFFNFGAAIAWKAISIGVEGRWGNAKYHGVSVDDDADDVNNYISADGIEDIGMDDVLSTFRETMKIKSFRVYLSFRF